ncbi:MAG: DUF1579 family protein [Planctomycetota bacterium]
MRMNKTVFGMTAVAVTAFACGALFNASFDRIAMASPVQDHGHHHDHDHDHGHDHAHGHAHGDHAIPAGWTEDEMAAMMAAGTVGDHHRYLDPLVGTFEGTARLWMKPDAPVMEFPSTVTREWILDGHFLKETIVSHSDMGEFKAIAIIGYNNMDGRYEMVWMENMSTALTTMHGSYNPDENVFRSYGTMRDPATGKMVTQWSEMDMSNHDVHIAEGWSVGTNGKAYRSFEGRFERTAG